MTPIERMHRAEYLQSREFIFTAIKMVGKTFDLNKSFSDTCPNHGIPFSPEAVKILDKLVLHAKENFAQQNIDLAAFVAETIKNICKK